MHHTTPTSTLTSTPPTPHHNSPPHLHSPPPLPPPSPPGVLHIADTYNCRIRRVDPSGIISTVAGYNGAVSGISCGSTGDSTSTATSALLNLPTSIFFDQSNNMYVADFANNKIRKVLSYCYSGCSNIITTLAGTGAASYAGDGGAATSAALNNPYSVVVDSTGRARPTLTQLSLLIL